MGFHGVQLLGLAVIGLGIVNVTQGNYSGNTVAGIGVLIVLVGLFVDWFIDDRMQRHFHPIGPRP